MCLSRRVFFLFLLLHTLSLSFFFIPQSPNTDVVSVDGTVSSFCALTSHTPVPPRYDNDLQNKITSHWKSDAEESCVLLAFRFIFFLFVTVEFCLLRRFFHTENSHRFNAATRTLKTKRRINNGESHYSFVSDSNRTHLFLCDKKTKIVSNNGKRSEIVIRKMLYSCFE